MRKSRKLAVVEQPQPVERLKATPAELLMLLEHELDTDVKYGEKHLAEWKLRFEKDAAYAFEWSRDSFEQAARVRVAKAIQGYIETCKKKNDCYTVVTELEIIQGARNTIYEEVIRKARWPKHSTSVQSNEMSLAMMAKWAEMLVQLDTLLRKS